MSDDDAELVAELQAGALAELVCLSLQLVFLAELATAPAAGPDERPTMLRWIAAFVGPANLNAEAATCLAELESVASRARDLLTKAQLERARAAIDYRWKARGVPPS